jgi:hypothetical protein
MLTKMLYLRVGEEFRALREILSIYILIGFLV